jgi:hypothetical protein
MTEKPPENVEEKAVSELQKTGSSKRHPHFQFVVLTALVVTGACLFYLWAEKRFEEKYINNTFLPLDAEALLIDEGTTRNSSGTLPLPLDKPKIRVVPIPKSSNILPKPSQVIAKIKVEEKKREAAKPGTVKVIPTRRKVLEAASDYDRAAAVFWYSWQQQINKDSFVVMMPGAVAGSNIDITMNGEARVKWRNADPLNAPPFASAASLTRGKTVIMGFCKDSVTKSAYIPTWAFKISPAGVLEVKPIPVDGEKYENVKIPLSPADIYSFEVGKRTYHTAFGSADKQRLPDDPDAWLNISRNDDFLVTIKYDFTAIDRAAGMVDSPNWMFFFTSENNLVKEVEAGTKGVVGKISPARLPGIRKVIAPLMDKHNVELEQFRTRIEKSLHSKADLKGMSLFEYINRLKELTTARDRLDRRILALIKKIKGEQWRRDQIYKYKTKTDHRALARYDAKIKHDQELLVQLKNKYEAAGKLYDELYNRQLIDAVRELAERKQRILNGIFAELKKDPEMLKKLQRAVYNFKKNLQLRIYHISPDHSSTMVKTVKLSPEKIADAVDIEN